MSRLHQLILVRTKKKNSSMPIKKTEENCPPPKAFMANLAPQRRGVGSRTALSEFPWDEPQCVVPQVLAAVPLDSLQKVVYTRPTGASVFNLNCPRFDQESRQGEGAENILGWGRGSLPSLSSFFCPTDVTQDDQRNAAIILRCDTPPPPQSL